MGLHDSSIPEESLPQCWSDDVRMNALFAPFRLKSANPESWDMKMKFWSDMLRVWCKCKKDPLVSASDAKFAFQRKGRTPACIDIVVEEMFRNGDLSPISKYQQYLHNGPEGWMRWGTRIALKPAAIAMSAVTSLLPARQATDNDGLPKASIDPTMRFVLESAVKDQATELLQNYPPSAERIGTVEELTRNAIWEHGKDTFEVLLGYLVCQGSAVKKGDVVKLAELNKKASPVTESDEAVVKLLSAEARLSRDADKLSRDVFAAEQEAKAALQTGNRVAAKNHLRRKHQLAARAVKCESALENVRQLLMQMKEADVNNAIFDTYKTTSQAMKRNMTDTGLNEDTVHDTMDDLRDVMESINEVEKALAGPTAAEDLDQAELEAELKDLLAGGGSGGGTPVKKESIPTLPSPPRERPSRVSERDFVFDGEERVLAELAELGIDDSSPRDRKPKPREKISLADGWEGKSPRSKLQSSTKPSQSWYPPSNQFTKPEEAWNNNLDTSFELRLDDRLHPGQPLNVDFTSPARLYNTDFVVPDHQMADGVWLYNSKDSNSNIPGNNRVQPSNTGVQPGNIGVQPGNIGVQPGNIGVQPGNMGVQPCNIGAQDITRIPTNKFLYNSKDTDIEEHKNIRESTPISRGKTPGRKPVPSNQDNAPFDNSMFLNNIPSGNTQILPGTRNVSAHLRGTDSSVPDIRNLTSVNRNLAQGFSALPAEDSTEYFSPSSPGKSIGSFQMAPGGERKHSNAWNADETPLDDLESRLRNLRGFNL